jgi:hypothetical protein
MNTVIDLALEYNAVLGAGLLVLLGLLCLISETFRGQLKKGVVFLLIVAGLGFGYYLFTGKSPSDIPVYINKFLNRRPAKVEPSHRYYQDRKEHYTVPTD